MFIISRYCVSSVIRQSFFLPKQSQNSRLFRKGKIRIIAKILRTDLVISCHSREGKTSFYSRIDLLQTRRRVVGVAWLCVSSRPDLAMRRLENSLCKPSSKWVSFFELGKDKAAKGEGWAPPFIGCAQDTVGLQPPLPLRLLDFGKPLPFYFKYGNIIL